MLFYTMLWVGYFIYFKFTPVFFNGGSLIQLKKTNRLRKEINSLSSKGISLIQLNK